MDIVSVLFAVLCSLILPVAAVVYLCSKKKGFWKPILAGAATFVIFQVLIRIPIIQLVLPNTQWFLMMSTAQPLLYSLFLGITAGLAEELGRYLIMSLFLKKSRSTIHAIAFGVGHGGIEAIMLVGVNSLLMLFAARQNAVPSLMFAGGIERVATLVIQISLSVMVMKSVREKKPLWLLAAFGAHALIDVGASLASLNGVSVWLIEGAIVLCAVSAAAFTMKEYRKERI